MLRGFCFHLWKNFRYEFSAYGAFRIETQNVLLGERQSERIIEVGPGVTLTNMLKHTITHKYETHDAANSISRSLLSVKLDSNEIYYRQEPILEESSSEIDEVRDEYLPPPVPAIIPVPENREPSSLEPDVPVTTEAIIQVLIADKLRKVDGGLPPLTSSIRNLAGGMTRTFLLIC